MILPSKNNNKIFENYFKFQWGMSTSLTHKNPTDDVLLIVFD